MSQLTKTEEEKLTFLSHVKGLELNSVKNILKVSYSIISSKTYWILTCYWMLFIAKIEVNMGGILSRDIVSIKNHFSQKPKC